MPTKQQLFETIDWVLFSAGGMIAAFLLPAHVFVTVILGPLALAQPIPPALTGAQSPVPSLLVKLYLFLVLGGAAWHALHRIRFILMNLGLAHQRTGITILVFATLIGVVVQTLTVLFLT